MANTAGKRVVSGMTNGASVDLVYLSDPGFGVEVANISGNGNLWFTISHPGGPCPPPTVGGPSGEWCAASSGGAAVQKVRHAGQFGSIVQLVSSPASVTYSVSVTGARINE